MLSQKFAENVILDYISVPPPFLFVSSLYRASNTHYMFHQLCLCQYWCISVPSYHVFELIKLERNEANTKISNANAYRMYQPYLFYFTEASFNRTIFLCSLYLNIVNILKNSATTTKIFNTTQSYF